jgi:hypothetical protein
MYVVEYCIIKINAKAHDNYLSFKYALKRYLELVDEKNIGDLKVYCNDQDITQEIKKFIER